MIEYNNSDFDYNPETDDLPSHKKWVISLAAIALALYLAFVLV
jgi:hypothetical protein